MYLGEIKEIIVRDYHLSVLGLDGSATDEAIKSAYRECSKKYHPDLNHSPDAAAQFIRIMEAYEYLKHDNASPLNDYFNQDFSQSNDYSEQELRRMEYNRRVREKAIESQRLQLELIVKILYYFKPIAFIVLLLNGLMAIDYFLPLSEHEQEIIGVNKIYESSTGTHYYGRTTQYRYDEMYFNDFTMRFNRGEVILLDHYEKAIVQATMIFSKPMYVIITVDGKSQLHKQIYNIYYIFGYLIPVMLLICALFFWIKKPMQKFNMAIVMTVFAIVQMVVFLS